MPPSIRILTVTTPNYTCRIKLCFTICMPSNNHCPIKSYFLTYWRNLQIFIWFSANKGAEWSSRRITFKLKLLWPLVRAQKPSSSPRTVLTERTFHLFHLSCYSANFSFFIRDRISVFIFPQKQSQTLLNPVTLSLKTKTQKLYREKIGLSKDNSDNLQETV